MEAASHELAEEMMSKAGFPPSPMPTRPAGNSPSISTLPEPKAKALASLQQAAAHKRVQSASPEEARMAHQARRLEDDFEAEAPQAQTEGMEVDDEKDEKVAKMTEAEIEFAIECRNAEVYEQKAKHVEDMIQQANAAIDSATEQADRTRIWKECEAATAEDKEWLKNNLQRQTAHIAEVQRRKLEEAAKESWKAKDEEPASKEGGKAEEETETRKTVQETKKEWDKNGTQRQGGWGNWRGSQGGWGKGYQYQGNWKQDSQGAWTKAEEEPTEKADATAGSSKDGTDYQQQGHGRQKGRGKGKSKVEEKIARIEAYTCTEDVWDTGDRKQMFEAWAAESTPASEAVEITELGAPSGLKKVTAAENEWAQNFLKASAADVAKYHESTFRNTTQVILNQMNNTIEETQHLLRHTAMATVENERQLRSDQVRIHGFSFGSPPIENRVAIVKSLAEQLGMEKRDVQDVQEEDRWVQLHKTAIIKFRNQARAESFTSRMFSGYPKGAEVYDPIEEAQLGPNDQQEPWVMWMTKMEPSVEEMKQKVFKACCAQIHTYCPAEEVEKLWKVGLINVEGDAVVLISYQETTGRCLIKVREDHYTNFHSDFSQVLLQKIGTRREQAMHQIALDNGNHEKVNAVLNQLAERLPWKITICKMNSMGGEPIDYLRAKTAEDTEIQVAKGQLKGRGKGKDWDDEAEEEGVEKGQSKGGRGKGKGKKSKGRGKSKGNDKGEEQDDSVTEAAAAGTAGADKK